MRTHCFPIAFLYIFFDLAFFFWTLLSALIVDLACNTDYRCALGLVLLNMEEYPNCVMCRRGFYRGRYQAHILGENLPEVRPAFSAYLQEHAMLEVSKSLVHI